MGSCMAETGIVRFPGSLDPSAEEFRPINITNPPLQGTNTVIPTTPPQPHQLFFPLYPPTVLPYTHHHLHQFPVLPLTYVAAAPILLPAQTPSSAATRSLLLSLVPTDVTESAVRRELEAFGELRGVQMERLSDGIVTVHFYDLRHAESALREIRNQLLQQQSRIRRYYTSYYGNVAYSVNRLVEDFQRVNTPLSSPVRAGLITGRAVWAQFVSPSSNATISDSHNQGTIVVFNLDSEVSTTFLKGIFEVYGAVRELKETPTKKQQWFVEFYDVRGAAKALNDMNGKAVFGKPVVIEFSRPGGHYNNNNNRNNNKSSSFNAASCHGLQNPQRPPPPPPPVPRHFPSHHPPLPPPRSYHSRQVSHQIFPTKKLSSAKKAILNNNSVVVERDLEKKTASSDSKKCGGHYNNSINKVSRKGGGRTSSSRKHDSRFLIDTNAMLESDFRDSRTTVMIKNIPNKYR